MRQPFVVAYALLRQAEALVAVGDNAAAGAAATEAKALGAGLGAAPLVGEIDALIRRARLRPDASATASEAESANETDATDPFGLTPREVEVLRLVADGCSNNQIAQQLFISRATASVHFRTSCLSSGYPRACKAAALAHRRGLAVMTSEGDAPQPGLRVRAHPSLSRWLNCSSAG